MLRASEGLSALKRIQSSLSGLKDSQGYIIEEFEVDSRDPEDKYIRDISRGALEQIDSLSRSIKWVTSPVAAEGRLVKNNRDRYEIEGTEIELTSGSTVDAYDDDERWRTTRVEHNGEDYYIVGLGRDTKIHDVLVRVR